MEGPSTDSNQKKDPFEELSKDDLVKKCRQFLAIAQKAKQSKDVLNEENKTISKKFEEVESKLQNDVQAMQEMLSTLTQQKLELVTENDTLSKQTVTLNSEVKKYQQELTDTKIKIQDLDIENQHFNRQVKRLSEENDQLISHLDTLEKRIDELNTIGEQQREQLLILEKNTAKNEKQDEDNEKLSDSSKNEDSNNVIEELKMKCNKYETELSNTKLTLQEKDKKLESLGEEIDTLKMKNEQTNQLKNFCQQKNNDNKILENKITELNNIIEDFKADVSSKNSEIKSLTKDVNDLKCELEITKKAKDHYNEKFKSYHSKLIKVFTDLRDLKQYKNILLSIVEDYSKCISKWQKDMKDVSVKFNCEILKLDSEIKKLRSKNHVLKQKITELENTIANQNNNVEGGEELFQNIDTELHTNEMEMKNLLEELKHKTEDNDKLLAENIELKYASKILDNKVVSYIADVQELNGEIMGLKENKTQYEMDMIEENEKYVKLQKAKAAVDTELHNLEHWINCLLEEKHQLEDKVKGQVEELERQRAQFQNEMQHVKHLTLVNNQRLSCNNTDLVTNLKVRIGELEEEVENLRKKNVILEQENSDLVKERESLQKTIVSNNKDLIRLNDVFCSYDILKIEKNKIDAELQEQLDKNDILIKEKNDLLETMTSKDVQFETLTNENKKMFEAEKEYQNQISELNNIVNDLRNQLKNNSIQNEELTKKLSETEKRNQNQIFDLNNIVDDLRNQLKIVSVQNEELIKTLSEEKSELTEKVNFFNETINKYEKELSCYKFDLTELQNQLSLSKRENVELLKEMNDMNQALKERGETISKQQELSQEFLRKIQNLEQEEVDHNHQKTKLEEELSATLQQKNELLEEKKEKIKNLEQEIQQLRESFNSSFGRENQDGDNETMSTSTISRMDETARLKDLEGSWEERYSKLRTLALKLKAKVKEQNEQLTQEKSEKTEIQNKLTAITRNLQSVQVECDKIQDQFELLNKENKKTVKQIESLTKENEKITHDLNSSLENVTKLQIELESLRKEKIGSNTAAKQFTNQIHSLKKEIEVSGNKIKELEIKISKLENNLCSKETEFQNEIKAHNITKEKLQKIDKEIKKNSVLSLEMDDYERSLKDLSQKLEKKNNIISNLEEKHNAQEDTINALKGQLKICEEKVLEEETRTKNLEIQLLESQTKISTSEAAVAQKENRIREAIKTLEDYKIKSEEVNSELTQIVTQNQKQLEQLKTERDHLKSLVLGLEEKTKELTKSANDHEHELHHLQNEFSSYKVRAQSVLRQNQTRDVALEERLKEEVSELKSQNELLSAQLDNISCELKSISHQFEQVTYEKSQVFSQCQELEKILSKEKADNNNLLERQQQLITEHRESNRAQKVHTDTLTQCYKQQIAEQEERHIKEITELRAMQLQSSVHILNKTQDESVDIASMPREDAEGSESIESNTNNQFSKSSILPLDKLLNSDIESNITLDYEVELSQCRKRLMEFEAKVKHLTDLLADTEQDLAKHAQLNQMLKEEIRRHQRSVEREKHAENLEYLKNVIFKFLTLNNGDEKSHLIPVLNTILKLSPEETQKLNTVAKGTDNSIRGWGSYLPLWSGSNNQQ